MGKGVRISRGAHICRLLLTPSTEYNFTGVDPGQVQNFDNGDRFTWRSSYVNVQLTISAFKSFLLSLLLGLRGIWGYNSFSVNYIYMSAPKTADSPIYTSITKWSSPTYANTYALIVSFYSFLKMPNPSYKQNPVLSVLQNFKEKFPYF